MYQTTKCHIQTKQQPLYLHYTNSKTNEALKKNSGFLYFSVLQHDEHIITTFVIMSVSIINDDPSGRAD